MASWHKVLVSRQDFHDVWPEVDECNHPRDGILIPGHPNESHPKVSRVDVLKCHISMSSISQGHLSQRLQAREILGTPKGNKRKCTQCKPCRNPQSFHSVSNIVSCFLPSLQASLNAEVHGGTCLSRHLCLSLQCHSTSRPIHGTERRPKMLSCVPLKTTKNTQFDLENSPVFLYVVVSS